LRCYISRPFKWVTPLRFFAAAEFQAVPFIEVLRNEKIGIKKKFKIVEALYKEAVALGVFPLKDSLEGLEVDIRIARGINSVSKDT
jgi:hypothetical protein